MKIALFVGRFQPFHNGHLSILKELSKKYDVVKIAIGSSQYHSTADNPFKASERRMMAKSVLNGLDNVKIYYVPDVNSNNLWVSHIRKRVGEFDVVYSNNPLVGKLMRARGKRVNGFPLRYGLSATKIRKMVCDGKSVVKHIPAEVNKILKKIKGFERIKKFC